MDKKLKLPDRKLSKEENDIWRVGFQMGSEQALRDNDIALQIGRSILSVLDNRYEFVKENY